MNFRLIGRWLAAGVAAFLGNQARAEDQPYEPVSRAWIEVGGLFAQETDISFPGSSGDATLELDPGIRVGIGSGYAVTHYFAVDWEVALLISSVKDASGVDEMDARLTQVPFMVNATFQYENETGFTPFIGAGIGAAITAINIDEARLGTTTVDGNDYDFVFAWQLLAGVRYAINERLGIGLRYKYLWTADAQWDDPDLEVDGIQSHAILAFLSYRF